MPWLAAVVRRGVGGAVCSLSSGKVGIAAPEPTGAPGHSFWRVARDGPTVLLNGADRLRDRLGTEQMLMLGQFVRSDVGHDQSLGHHDRAVCDRADEVQVVRCH